MAFDLGRQGLGTAKLGDDPERLSGHVARPYPGARKARGRVDRPLEVLGGNELAELLGKEPPQLKRGAMDFE
jgi:hypothetical protein